jgi:hypothetical protein
MTVLVATMIVAAKVVLQAPRAATVAVSASLLDPSQRHPQLRRMRPVLRAEISAAAHDVIKVNSVVVPVAMALVARVAISVAAHAKVATQSAIAVRTSARFST